MFGGGNPPGGIIVPAEDAVYQPLSTDGAGGGTISQNVNGSSTPVLFYIQPGALERYILKRMNLHAIDGNWNNASQYGALGTALANGIQIYKEINGGAVIKDYTEFMPIKRTHDWALLAGVDSVNVGGAGEDALIVRWTFNLGYSDIELDGSKNERLVLEVPDNLTGLTDQIAFIQGFKKEIAA